MVGEISDLARLDIYNNFVYIRGNVWVPRSWDPIITVPAPEVGSTSRRRRVMKCPHQNL